MLDTVKLSEAENGLVFRLYESIGARGKTKLAVCPKIAKIQNATLCDLLENQEEYVENGEMSLDLAENAISLVFRPFQFKTILVTFEF